MLTKKIRVILIDDSPVALAVIKSAIESDTSIQVVESFLNPKSALLHIPQIDPDVICVDFFMNGMDGLEFIKIVMSKFPKPVLVISRVVGSDSSKNIFDLISAGAIDIIEKPTSGHPKDYLKTELIYKIKLASGVKILSRKFDSNQKIITSSSHKRFNVIGIGASTGGPKTVYEILQNLPASFPIPILVSQHITFGFLNSLVQWMNKHLQLKVKIATNEEPLVAGYVYYAPENTNLLVSQSKKTSLLPKTHQQTYCPSIDIMMNSIAQNYKQAAIGILLTGMGNDGAAGMKYLQSQGGMTIAQEETSCVIYGMPKAAIEQNAAQKILPPVDIAKYLMYLAKQHKSVPLL